MGAEILSGSQMKDVILEELKNEVVKIQEQYGVPPGLVTILVGQNPASESYVKLKIKTALSLGFYEVQDNQPEDITEEALLALIEKYNNNSLIHGILVQLPLPKHINEERVITAIRPDKDVDGFHPINVGKMTIGKKGLESFSPCTPLGIQEMLIRAQVETSGAHVVVVGRSNIVGRPLSIMLSQKGLGGDATVTLVHTKTKNIERYCKKADILIAAVGIAEFVKGDWVKPGAVVIDVGVNRLGINKETGKAQLVGDVEFERARNVASKITPVPGGVGPMTIAMLMKNTVQAAYYHNSKK